MIDAGARRWAWEEAVLSGFPRFLPGLPPELHVTPIGTKVTSVDLHHSQSLNFIKSIPAPTVNSSKFLTIHATLPHRHGRRSPQFEFFCDSSVVIGHTRGDVSTSRTTHKGFQLGTIGVSHTCGSILYTLGFQFRARESNSDAVSSRRIQLRVMVACPYVGLVFWPV